MFALMNALIATGELVDVGIESEHIVSVGPLPESADSFDCGGRLLLPAFIDTHVHLDKVLIRDDLAEHNGTLAGAIGAIHARKRAYTGEDVRARARAVIESSVRLGTTRLRSNVDVDTIGGLTPLEGVLAAAADCAGIAGGQGVAFPQ